MRDTRDFYEDYWRWRVEQQHLNQRLPERVNAALRLLAGSASLGRVLDRGCGEGSFGAAVRARGGATELLGIDISEQALALAQRHYDQVVQLNVEQASLSAQLGDKPLKFLQPRAVRHLPLGIRMLLNRCFPNLFGYQIVIRALPC